MTRRLVPLATLALAAFAAIPAQAESVFYADCGYSTVRTLPARLDPTYLGGGRFTGTLYFAAVLEPGSDGQVAEADVSCELRVNGDLRQTLGPVRVTGAGTAARTVSFTLQETDVMSLCTIVRYTDGRPPYEICPSSSSYCALNCVPYWEPVRSHVEATVCAQTGGDVYAGDTWVLDCPEYGPY